MDTFYKVVVAGWVSVTHTVAIILKMSTFRPQTCEAHTTTMSRTPRAFANALLFSALFAQHKTLSCVFIPQLGPRHRGLYPRRIRTARPDKVNNGASKGRLLCPLRVGLSASQDCCDWVHECISATEQASTDLPEIFSQWFKLFLIFGGYYLRSFVPMRIDVWQMFIVYCGYCNMWNHKQHCRCQSGDDILWLQHKVAADQR